MTTLAHDFIAHILREHFQTEASDAGLRSPDLLGTGGGSPDPEARISQRKIDRQELHRRVRHALQQLDPNSARLLELAYGCPLRDREEGIPSRARKHGRVEEPGWRFRFRAAFGSAECLIALQSPSARRYFEAHLAELSRFAAAELAPLPDRVEATRASAIRVEVRDAGRSRLLPTIHPNAVAAAERAAKEAERGMVEWLLSVATQNQRDRFLAEARELLAGAESDFARAYQSLPIKSRSQPPRKRESRSGRERARVLAFHSVDGQKIGR